jgi:hypothetical protein
MLSLIKEDRELKKEPVLCSAPRVQISKSSNRGRKILAAPICAKARFVCF